LLTGNFSSFSIAISISSLLRLLRIFNTSTLLRLGSRRLPVGQRRKSDCAYLPKTKNGGKIGFCWISGGGASISPALAENRSSIRFILRVPFAGTRRIRSIEDDRACRFAILSSSGKRQALCLKSRRRLQHNIKFFSRHRRVLCFVQPAIQKPHHTLGKL
jgi:hypothetical protein